MEKSDLNIRLIIRQEVALIFENFEFNDAQRLNVFRPTDAMKKNASDALLAVEKNDLTSHGGNEGSGKNKAKDISEGEPISHAMLKRMKAFFDNNYSFYSSEKSLGKNIENSGIIQTWNLWGGDAAKAFVDQHINSLNKVNLNRKKVRRVVDTGKTKTIMDPHNSRNK